MAKIQATMSTEIALDTLQAANSIKRLTQLVNSSTNAWKAQESQMRSAGDYLGAAQAKYEGLSNTIQNQQQKIEKLKQEQSQLKGNTVEVAEQYLKYQQQIDQATTRLAALENQQRQAKQSMSYYQSGLADLQRSYRLSNDLSESYVKRLQAEGRESEALQAKLNASKNAVNNLNKQYEAQVKLLKEVAQSGDGDAYIKQKIRINETASAIAKAKREQIELANELRKSNPTFFDKLKAGIHGTNSKIDELGRNVNRSNSILGTFRERLSFGAIAGMASSAIQSISSSVMGLSGEVMATSDAIEKFESTMNFAGKTKKETEEASKYFKTYADKTVYDLQDVANTGAQLASNGIEKYKEITIASGNLNAVAGGNKETFKSLGMVLTQTAGAGKLTTENWNQLADAIPGASGKLQEALSKNGAFVGDFREALENGEISSEEFLTAIEQLGNSKSAEKAAKSTKTFEGAFGSLKSTVVSGMKDMIDAVGKEKITKSITGFGDSVQKIFDYLKDHKKELSSIGKSIFEISKIFGMAVWNTAKGIIVEISDSISAMNGHSKKSKDHLKNIASALKEVSKHKEAIQTIGKLFVGYFASKAVLNTSKSLFGTITDGISNVKKAGSKVNGALNWVMGVRGEDAVKNKLGGIKKIGRGTKSAFKWTASVATKTAKLALTGLLNTAKFVGNGIKLAFNFAKANPLILIATAVIGISTALYELYKHNKEFKKFVDGIFSAAKKAFDKIFKVTKEIFGKVINFFKKDWKQVLLFIANPVAGAFALIYKYNKKFKKFVDDLAKNAKKAFDNIVKWFKDIPKNLSKTWENIKDGAKSGMKNLGSAITGKLSDIGKEWKKGWKNSKDYLSDRWDDMKGNTKESIKRLGSSIKDKHDEIHDRWSKTWNKSKNFLSDRWDDMNAETKKKFGNDLKGLLFDNLDKIKNKFQDTWSGIKDGFGDMWDVMKRLAGDGINAVIAIPNTGIDGINGLIHDFGGPKNAIGKIPKVKFADGTGLFSSYRNPITRPTLATLNDGNDSPETNNQEMVILPNGKSFLPQGRNVEYLLPAGSEVINASELAMLMGVERGAYAKGTGFWSKVWDTTTNVAGSVWNGMKNGVDKFKKMIEFIGSAIKDPVGTLAKKFSPNADKLGAMFTPLGNALYKNPVGEAKNWWKELWSMANASMDEGTVAIGAKGDDYRFKDKAKDAGVDPWGYYYRECVSFIASRLANLGVNPSLFSHLGNGNQWVSARVPHLSRPKPGVVSVYTGGPVSSNHVDFVTAVHGDTYDGEDYNYNGDGKYHQFTGRHVKNAATFLDFGVRDFGSSGDSGKALKDRNNPLQTLIKRQVGGMFDWIKKTLGPLLSPAGGGEDHPQGTGVARWRDTVVRALEANGIEANNFRVSKILATIQKESGGNPNAQNNWDINARMGDPSIGLMQTIGRTFNAYKHQGHNNIRNGYDNLLAAINYIKHRYGTSDAAFNYVATHGYANGGLVRKNGVYELAEGDMPEYVIPTDIAKRGRAWRLLSEAVAHFAGDAPQNNHDDSSSQQRVSMLESKLDVVIGLLSQLVTNGSKPIEIQNIIDGRSVSNGLAPFMTKATNEYERRQALLGGSII
ncbi:tail length tape-measure protein [Streptococcus phage CHPC928]|uniref:Tail length tape-measure protein n=1 Tax=Streptococcus phage CHPC928 TaxID=2365049 RepID=A0A3G8F848_9CAUD|nr:tail length tape-measure protein [Streptococcus phage CHPC928]AZF90909.1 tail length tape-measure protein [Streptococcus phage CHPC928]